MRLRASYFILLTSLALACSDASPTAPPGALIGRWGGEHVELVADARAATFQFVCGPLTGVGPIIPEASGKFVYPVRSDFEYGNMSVTIVGTVVDDVINFDAVTTTTDGSFTSSFVVARDGVADYSSMLCALAASRARQPALTGLGQPRLPAGVDDIPGTAG